MRASAALAMLLPFLLAGCGTPAPSQPSGIPFNAHFGFPLPPDATQEGNDVVWHFLIQNNGESNSTPATLHIEIMFNNAPKDPPVERDIAIPSMIPSDARPFTVATPYKGKGDYAGPATILVDGDTVAITAGGQEWNPYHLFQEFGCPGTC